MAAAAARWYWARTLFHTEQLAQNAMGMDMSMHTDSDADHEARHESRHEDGKGEFDPIAAEAEVAASEPPPQAAGAGEEEEGAALASGRAHGW